MVARNIPTTAILRWTAAASELLGNSLGCPAVVTAEGWTGARVGLGVGDLVGESVGFDVGDLVGESVGFNVG
jgi:hypothetical protein